MRDYKRLIKSIRSHNNREIGCYECEYLFDKNSITDPLCIKRMLNDAADAIEELLLGHENDGGVLMADKYISTNAIYDELSDIFIEYLATTSNTDTRNALDSLYHTVLSAVDAAPSATDTNIVGKWVNKTMTVPNGHGQTYSRWGCSKCKAKFKTRTNYCPNCGAKMEVTSDA